MPIEAIAKERLNQLRPTPPVAVLVGLKKALDWLRAQGRRSPGIRRSSVVPHYLLQDTGAEWSSSDWIARERAKRLRLGINW